MKTINIIYWISTVLLAALMLSSALPSLKGDPDAAKFMVQHLHYPSYFGAALGVAKLLGIIAILVPGFPRIREWAYAGFAFDLIAALYSFIAVKDPLSSLTLFPVFFAIWIVSYIYWHKKLRAAMRTDAVV
jgi:DoxX-like family